MNINRYIFSSNIKSQIYPLSGTIIKRAVCKIDVTVHKDLLEKFEKNELKHRHHPGRIKTGNISVPEQITQAIHKAIGDFPIKTLVKDGKVLNQYILARHPPPEEADLQQKIQQITKELDEKFPMPSEEYLRDEDLEKRKYMREQKLQKTLKERTFSWKPLQYGTYEALVYAIGRSAKEYAVLLSVFKEIQARDPDFKPRSFFDFGSGVGTAMWAASRLWKDAIFEYVNVDVSREMNDLSDLILRDGNENQQATLRNVFHRQFLPSLDTKFDLVVSAFTLFEMPSAKDRKEIIHNLWKKCDGYMVIIEEGSRKGFELINEVRSNIMRLKNEDRAGFVFAPCPHDLRCPRLADKEDKTPCNFEVKHEPLGLGERNTAAKTARYSYVILKKGKREDEKDSWPRIVRPTLVRSKHTVCRMCTSQGILQEIVFTQSKHGRDAYRCARSSEWGDRLPIKIGDIWPPNKPKRDRKVSAESDEAQEAISVQTEEAQEAIKS